MNPLRQIVVLSKTFTTFHYTLNMRHVNNMGMNDGIKSKSRWLISYVFPKEER